jgi:hypothetical protein
MRRTLFAAVLAGLFTAGAAAAQGQPAVAPGTRVRVYVATLYNAQEVASLSGYHVGTVGAVDSSAVTLQEEGGAEFRIPFTAVRRFEVSRGAASAREGMRLGARKGALLGAGIGAGVLGLRYGITKLGDLLQKSQCPLETLTCENDTGVPGGGLLHPSWGNAGKMALIGGAAGALLGVAIGSTGREHWEALPVRTLRLQLAPAANGGTAVSLRL